MNDELGFKEVQQWLNGSRNFNEGLALLQKYAGEKEYNMVKNQKIQQLRNKMLNVKMDNLERDLGRKVKAVGSRQEAGGSGQSEVGSRQSAVGSEQIATGGDVSSHLKKKKDGNRLKQNSKGSSRK